MSKRNADIGKWNVEDAQFWEQEGKHIANRNLWISIPSLLMGFAVWDGKLQDRNGRKTISMWQRLNLP